VYKIIKEVAVARNKLGSFLPYKKFQRDPKTAKKLEQLEHWGYVVKVTDDGKEFIELDNIPSHVVEIIGSKNPLSRLNDLIKNHCGNTLEGKMIVQFVGRTLDIISLEELVAAHGVKKGTVFANVRNFTDKLMSGYESKIFRDRTLFTVVEGLGFRCCIDIAVANRIKTIDGRKKCKSEEN